MKSIKELYKIGRGPSSSHTMGPKFAADQFYEKNSNASAFRVTLFGSLAATGRGHLTDTVIIETFRPKKTKIIWKPENELEEHPNAMKFEALDAKGKIVNSWIVFSIGGGTVVDDLHKNIFKKVYNDNNMTSILHAVEKKGHTFWEYVYTHEDKDLEEYLCTIWDVMKESIKRGLDNEGVLPGRLHLRRKAASFYMKAMRSSGFQKHTNKLFAYALAVAEENASAGTIVTAPTCGAAGVLPAVLMVLQKMYHFSDEKIYHALATAGIFGNVVQKNGSISGAEVGCQGEIGTACAMASAAAAQLMGATPGQIEYAAEMGLEHHLGLTCDPVAGLVQIPCIERNAMGASRSVDCALYALLSDGKHRVSFDRVVKTMVQTGHDLASSYRETSRGGLAKFFRK